MADVEKTVKVVYEADGADAAKEAERQARALGGVATAGEKAGGELAEIEQAAKRAGIALKGTARDADTAGAGLGGLNDSVRENLSGFDELNGRIGQVGAALNILSGAAIIGVVSGFKDSVMAIYEWTEAGQDAKRATEAQTAALGSLASAYETLAAAGQLNVDMLLRKRAAEEGSLKADGDLTASIEKRAAADAELARLIKARAAVTEIDGQQNAEQSLNYLRLTDRISEQKGVIAALNTEVEKHAATLQATRAIRLQVDSDIEASTARHKANVDALGASTRALMANVAATFEHRVALAEAGLPATGMVDTLARLASAGIQAADAVGDKLAKGIAKAGGAARAEQSAIEAFAETWALFGDMQGAGDLPGLLDSLPSVGDLAAALNPGPEPVDMWGQLASQVSAAADAVRGAYDEMEAFDASFRAVLGLSYEFGEAIAPVESMLDGFGQAMAANVATAILYGESLQDMAATALTALRDQAATEAVFQTGKGLAALASAVFYPPAAAAATAHFASAGVFAGIGVAAGVGAAAAGGGADSGRSAAAGAAGGGGAGSRPDIINPPGASSANAGGGVSNYNFYGDVYDTREGAERAMGARATQGIAAQADIPGGHRLPTPGR